MAVPEILETERLILDAVAEGDVATLNRMRNDAETRRYLAPRPTESTEDTLAVLRRARADHDGGTAFNYAARLRPTGEFIGLLGMWRVDPDTGRGELGYMIDRDHWSRGYAGEALAAILAHIREVRPSFSLAAMVHEDNAASIRLLEGLGFCVEPRTGDEDPNCRRYGWSPTSL